MKEANGEVEAERSDEAKGGSLSEGSKWGAEFSLEAAASGSGMRRAE